MDLLCLNKVENYLGLEQIKTLWRHRAAELLTMLSSGVEPGLCFMSWLPRESVRRAQCLSLGWMLSLLAVGQFALEVRVTRSVPISVPRTAAFPDEVIFTCSLLSPLKLFSHPAGKSGGPKVEVGSKRGSASCSVLTSGRRFRMLLKCVAIS